MVSHKGQIIISAFHNKDLNKLTPQQGYQSISVFDNSYVSQYSVCNAK